MSNFIISFMFFITALPIVASAEILSVRFGIPGNLAIENKDLKTEKSHFYFTKEDSNLTLFNNFLNRRFDIVALPAEFALMAIGSNDEITIVGKSVKNKIQLISPTRNGELRKEGFAGMKILMRRNSSDEYYLKKYFSKMQYRPVYANSYKIKEVIKNDFQMKDSSIDAVWVGDEEILKSLERKNINTQEFDGETNYLLTMVYDNWIILNDSNRKALNANKLTYTYLDLQELNYLRNLNEHFTQRSSRLKRFDKFYNSMIKKL